MAQANPTAGADGAPGVRGEDPRRRIPRTDVLLAHPRIAGYADAGPAGRERAKAAILAAQAEARAGRLAPEGVADAAAAALDAQGVPSGRQGAGAHGRASSLGPVLNATGVVVHTNLGRAPLGERARAAVAAAAGYTDVELDLATGVRARRGAGAEAALLAAVPDAEAALPLNNGAAALLLAVAALGDRRRAELGGGAGGTAPVEVLLSRGEMVEIGAGFRLPELMATTGMTVREVGMTNRTHPEDYARAVTDATAAIVKVHPANFRVAGFTGGAAAGEVVGLHRPDGTVVPLVVDIGSGLLRHDPALPDEPDATTALRAGADLVTSSGDKLLGGPQAGIVLGRADAVAALRRHPLARALRVDKFTLAALEATVRDAAEAPVTRYRRRTRDDLRERTAALAAAVGGEVVEVEGRVGGGGAPGVPLPGLAVALPTPAEATARALRTGSPAVLPRITDGRCLVDLRCVAETDDAALTGAVVAAVRAAGAGDTGHRDDAGGATCG